MSTRYAKKHHQYFYYFDIPIDQDLQVTVITHY